MECALLKHTKKQDGTRPETPPQGFPILNINIEQRESLNEKQA
jgi:hypothetical protein